MTNVKKKNVNRGVIIVILYIIFYSLLSFCCGAWVGSGLVRQREVYNPQTNGMQNITIEK